jgi:hypothetical protein
MRISTLILLILFNAVHGISQTKNMKVNNLVVIAQQDRQEDRFTMEINITELLVDAGIKSMASLNVMKQGTNPSKLASDSIQEILKNKGFDTYLLCSVRGYDRKFKPATNFSSLEEELENGHLFPVYRDDITSVTFEFYFYRNGEFLGYDILKLNGASSRDTVLKKLRKKLPKKINKWKL